MKGMARMGKLIRLETKELPGLVVVGKELRYSMEALMKGDNRIGAFWGACFSEGVMEPLEAQPEYVYDESYVGIMLDWDKGDGDFSYIVGMLMKPGAVVPGGYVSRELAKGTAAVGFIQGKDTPDVCGNAHEETEKALREAGHSNAQMRWCMELYNCPRFTTPDEDGRIILDYYIPLD